MNNGKRPRLHLLAVLLFATATLGAVHLGTFVWLTAFVYHGNIRGYVPAGLKGLTILAVATLILLAYLGWLGHRHESGTSGYLLGGCLGVPVAVFSSAIYSSVLVTLLGYSLQLDVAVNAIGAFLFGLIAVVVHWLYLGGNPRTRR